MTFASIVFRNNEILRTSPKLTVVLTNLVRLAVTVTTLVRI